TNQESFHTIRQESTGESSSSRENVKTSIGSSEYVRERPVVHPPPILLVISADENDPKDTGKSQTNASTKKKDSTGTIGYETPTIKLTIDFDETPGMDPNDPTNDLPEFEIHVPSHEG
uniref:Uncharacterized protein n=1 Tax=Clytia hemisphaerica TaxID=252671 RepID=A0A7M6DPQ3_9CNID